MVRLKDMEVLLDLDLRYLNFRISEVFYDLQKSANSIEAKICKKILDLDIYTFLYLERNWIVGRGAMNADRSTSKLKKDENWHPWVLGSFSLNS